MRPNLFSRNAYMNFYSICISSSKKQILLCSNLDLFFCKTDRISLFLHWKGYLYYIRSNQFIFAICFFHMSIKYSEKTNIYENVNNCSVLALFFNISIFKFRLSWNFSFLSNPSTAFIICLLQIFGGAIIWFDMTDKKRIKLLLKLSRRFYILTSRFIFSWNQTYVCTKRYTSLAFEAVIYFCLFVVIECRDDERQCTILIRFMYSGCEIRRRETSILTDFDLVKGGFVT